MRRWLPWLPWAEKGGAIHEFRQTVQRGTDHQQPCAGAGAGHVFHHGHHHLVLQRPGHGRGGHRHPDPFQCHHRGYPQDRAGQDPYRHVHCGDRWLRDLRGSADPGIRSGPVRVAGRVHPPDRGELHHPGPGGVLLLQERCGRFLLGRYLPGLWLHCGADGYVHHP